MADGSERVARQRRLLVLLGLACVLVGALLGLLPVDVPLHGAGSWSWEYDRQVSCGSPWAPDYGNVRDVPDGVSLCESRFGSRGLMGALTVLIGCGLWVVVWLRPAPPGVGGRDGDPAES